MTGSHTANRAKACNGFTGTAEEAGSGMVTGSGGALGMVSAWFWNGLGMIGGWFGDGLGVVWGWFGGGLAMFWVFFGWGWVVQQQPYCTRTPDAPDPPELLRALAEAPKDPPDFPRSSWLASG